MNLWGSGGTGAEVHGDRKGRWHGHSPAAQPGRCGMLSVKVISNSGGVHPNSSRNHIVGAEIPLIFGMLFSLTWDLGSAASC